MDASLARERVHEARAGRLATIRPDGRPHVVVCCYALDGETIWSVVDGKPKTTQRLQRLRNVEATAAASLLVDHYDDDWTALWWVRLDGSARVVTAGDEHRRAIDGLCAKYAQYQHQRPDGPVLALDVERWSSWSARRSEEVPGKP